MWLSFKIKMTKYAFFRNLYSKDQKVKLLWLRLKALMAAELRKPKSECCLQYFENRKTRIFG
jgi:hypothetical protein